MTQAMGMKPLAIGVDDNALGMLGMASFGIASNTSWSFFMDRDNGIFFEMLTYPMRRVEYLVGKGLFNLLISIGQAVVTVSLRRLCRCSDSMGVSAAARAAMFIGTAGWFFFYAIFALTIRRDDLFNTVTSVFYFVLLFASSMFYPVEPLPSPLKELVVGEIRLRGTWMCFGTRQLVLADRRSSGSKPRRSRLHAASIAGALVR